MVQTPMDPDRSQLLSRLRADGYAYLEPAAAGAALGLDLAVLDGLREGGRMVGIVSHVAELKQRIPAQIRVHKGRSGSHLTQYSPA